MKDSKDPAPIGEPEREDESELELSRRAALGALGLTGLGLASGHASAQEGRGRSTGNEPWYSWEDDVDAGENELFNLGALETAANGESITDFVGENLTIQEGTLSAASTVNIVDVDDYGADPTGQEPSDDALDAASRT